MTKARSLASLGSVSDLGLMFRNRLINGDMRIDQRNSGGLLSLGNAGAYITDRWYTGWIIGATYTMQQVSDAPTGFKYSLKYAATSNSSVNDVNVIGQNIEANNVIDFDWGTINGKTVTLSFWVKSSIAGQHSGQILFFGGTTNYYYLPTYTVNAANTWEYKTITIPAPPSAAGAFAGTLNSAYMILRPVCISTTATTAQAGNTWTTSSSVKATGSVDLAATSGSSIQITGVQLEKGSVATPFEFRLYGIELSLCQRYFQKVSGGGNTRHATSGNGGSPNCFPTMWLKQTMRSTPSFSYSALSDFIVEGLTGGQATPTSLSLNAGTTDSITINCVTTSGVSTGGNLLGSGSGAWTAYSAEL